LPYFPPAGATAKALAEPGTPILVTEGEKKAARADQDGFPCIGLSGVWSWMKKRPRDARGTGTGPYKLLDALAAIDWTNRLVYIVFDSDAVTNTNVQDAERRLADALSLAGANVKIARLPAGRDDAKCGLDDFLLANGADALRELLAKAEDKPKSAGRKKARAGTSAAPGKSEDADDRPAITIRTSEHEVNDEATAALARDATLYQRTALLVRIVRDGSPAARGVRRPLAPRIDALPPALLRERLAANANWFSIKDTKAGPVAVPAHPPGWCVAAVHARADWPGIRHLEAVVEYPVLRPDGTILSKPGYDAATGLLLEPAGTFPEIPDFPTQDDAIAACDMLFEVVADFPFEKPVHRAAWLASLLTPPARFAFLGPSPLFLVDSNVRGAGKGLLLDCNSRIITGERFTIATYTSDEDELRKRITSLALAGDRLVLFDNLEGKFGNAVLDAALTGTAWKDRILGVNRMTEMPLYMTWHATGNNVAVAADTARRICYCRLESAEERPEERSGFRHPDLLAWVGANRGRLLVAALTILRAYCSAGRPDMGLPAWGSFEGWSGLVRSAVVWTGLPDPGETRLLLQKSVDVTAQHMSVLLDYWQQMDEGKRGLTAAEVIKTLYKEAPLQVPDWHADFKNLLEEMLDKPEARALGTKLRSYKRRIFGNRFIDQKGTLDRAVRWAVFPAQQFWQRPENTQHTQHTHTPPNECAECNESISAAGKNAEDDGNHGDAWEG
jgi:hypothetical protein